MLLQLPALGFCFTLCVLSLTGTAQGTYLTCCSTSTRYGDRCVCNPGYHDDGGHNRCVEPCWNKCKPNTVCNKYTFECSCSPGFVGNPYIGCKRPVSTFQFARSSYVVNENVGVVKLQIDRDTIGLSGKVTLYWKSTAISATLNSDYKGASGSLTFESGVRWKSIIIPIVNDQVFEQTETFKVTLTSASAGGQLGTRRVTTVTIRDNDPRPVSTFQFARSSYVVNENVGVVKLQIDRNTIGLSGKVTLYWKSTPITAKLNSDYKGASGSITFESGVRWKSIIIPIVNDQVFELTETFKVTLTSASAGGQLGTRRVTTVTIRDNDPRPVSTFQFARSSYVVNENVGVVKLQIDRDTIGLSGKVTLYWKSTAISATLNSDYKGASGSLTFESGVRWKSIIIPIVNDQVFEQTETFKVTLTSASAGGQLGTRRVTTVTIRDNDPRPVSTFQFARSSYVVNENVGVVKLQIDRNTIGLSGKVTLYWKSTPITAKLNSDYKGASGSITFESGVRWKSIIIPIVNDQVFELTETFKVTLTSASAGGQLGTRRVTTVTIRDNDPRPVSTFQFARSSYVVNENVGVVKLQIDRDTIGLSGKVTLYWKSTAISATLNSDYKGASGSLTFESGVRWKSIIIPIVNDQVYENIETFKVTLTSASIGGKLGARTVTVVTIKDDDLPCEGRCKNYRYSHCNYATNRCVCNTNYSGDPYNGGCRCNGGGGY